VLLNLSIPFVEIDPAEHALDLRLKTLPAASFILEAGLIRP
jgi:hypothetical protein